MHIEKSKKKKLLYAIMIRWNISLPPHSATKAIKISSLPGGGRKRRLHESSFSSSFSFSLKSASLSWKPPPISVESGGRSLQLPPCAYTLSLTLIHQSVNAILCSCKFNFPTLRETERDRLLCCLSCIWTGSSTANRGDNLANRVCLQRLAAFQYKR